jgi:hypothetical protein
MRQLTKLAGMVAPLQIDINRVHLRIMMQTETELRSNFNEPLAQERESAISSGVRIKPIEMAATSTTPHANPKMAIQRG